MPDDFPALKAVYPGTASFRPRLPNNADIYQISQ